MSKKIIAICMFIVIFIAACFVRLYKLGEIPAGVYLDEASLGYNAYSLLLTGKDEFGKSWPLLIRSFGTYQSPLYSVLSTVPIGIFGLSIASTRLLSVLSGLTVLLITFLFFYSSDLKNRFGLAIIASLVVASSPWAIFDSRSALEANLGLAITAIGVFLAYKSLKKVWLIVLSALVLSVSAYAYHGQQITGFLLLVSFLTINRKLFLRSKKIIFVSLAVFFIIQLPNIALLTKPGSLVRYDTQGYTSQNTFQKFGGPLTKVPLLGQPFYILRQFTSQYLSGFSPRSLFYEPEPQLVRSIPNLSVFYIWMIIPFFVGFYALWKQRSNPLIQIIFLLMLIGVVPEAITGDPFYTLRFLPALWGMAIMISFGIKNVYDLLKPNYTKVLLTIFLISFSAINFYACYFVLLKHERSIWYGYPFEVLAQITEDNPNQTYVLDSETYDAPYIWMAFYKKYDPTRLQAQAPTGLVDRYYDDSTYYKYKTVGNVEVRKIDWGEDQCKDQLIVSDVTAVSPAQAIEHKFSLIREIKDLAGETVLWIYQTNPKEQCKN